MNKLATHKVIIHTSHEDDLIVINWLVVVPVVVLHSSAIVRIHGTTMPGTVDNVAKCCRDSPQYQSHRTGAARYAKESAIWTLPL